MNDWVKIHLDHSKALNSTQREAWWIALKWYFGYCSKKNLKDPCDRENGKVFWKDTVSTKKSTDRQRKQWGDALRCFFNGLVAHDYVGTEMRKAIRQRHLAYTTEKAYIAWLALKCVICQLSRKIQIFDAEFQGSYTQENCAEGLCLPKSKILGNPSRYFYSLS